MDRDKLIIGLISILAGWLLAQFTSIAKDWLYRRKVKKCLLEELSELKSELERTLLILSRQLQIHALRGIDNTGAGPMANHIFRNYYKDAVLGLNKHQRVSFQLIHTKVEAVNDELAGFKKVTAEIQNRATIKGVNSLEESDFKFWGEHVKSLFENVATTIWHIRFHLLFPKNPELVPLSKEHEQYLQYLEKVRNEIEKIINDAKSLSREKFEVVYNREHFEKKFF